MKRSIKTRTRYFYISHVTHDWFAIPTKVLAQTPQEALDKYLKYSFLEPTSLYKHRPYKVFNHKLRNDILCVRFLDSKYSFRYWVTEEENKTRNQKIFGLLCTLKDSIPFIYI